MPYSVSPLRTLNSVGGKNSEKRSTRMPTALAAAKCPKLVKHDQQHEADERDDPNPWVSVWQA